jgi:hypothetical protein
MEGTFVLHAVVTRPEVTNSTKIPFEGSGALENSARKKKEAYRSVHCAHRIVVGLLPP